MFRNGIINPSIVSPNKFTQFDPLPTEWIYLLVAMFCYVNKEGFLPTEQEVANSAANDHGDE